MNKIKILMLLSTSFTLSSSSCDRERDESSDDKLTMERVDYNGNELRIDGYYYRYWYADKEPDVTNLQVFFLYNNGLILDGVSFNINEITEKEENYKNGYYATQLANKFKWLWGVFQVDGNQIKYEKWVPVEGPLFTFTYEGVILNDTTFIINKNYKTKDGKKKETGEIYWKYHFKQFSPKPDSTNRFIP